MITNSNFINDVQRELLSTLIGRVAFSDAFCVSSNGDIGQSNQDQSEHKLNTRQSVTVSTYLTSISVSLLESRIMISAVRIDTTGPRLYRQQSSTFCDDGRENLFANSLCFRRGFVFTRGSSHRRLRDRSKPTSPPTLEAMRTQQCSVHQSTSITCAVTMFAVYMSCVFVAQSVCDWA